MTSKIAEYVVSVLVIVAVDGLCFYFFLLVVIAYHCVSKMTNDFLADTGGVVFRYNGMVYGVKDMKIISFPKTKTKKEC